MRLSELPTRKVIIVYLCSGPDPKAEQSPKMANTVVLILSLRVRGSIRFKIWFLKKAMTSTLGDFRGESVQSTVKPTKSHWRDRPLGALRGRRINKTAEATYI